MPKNNLEFIITRVPGSPPLHPPRPQVVFIGRSNVGKSSIINSLTGQDLARVSKKPGQTRAANIYLWQAKFYLVDLPGYGFAQGSRTEQLALAQLIEWYLEENPEALIVLVLDALVGPTENDKTVYETLIPESSRLLILANKWDKLKMGEREKMKRVLATTFPEEKVVFYSAHVGTGRSETQEIIMNDCRGQKPKKLL